MEVTIWRVDKPGRSIDCMLADRRNTRAAHRFLVKALTIMRDWPPASITNDQLGSYPKAIHRLQREGKLPADTKHRTCKYLNDIRQGQSKTRPVRQSKIRLLGGWQVTVSAQRC